MAIGVGGASTLMALITAVGASAFLGRIAITLCLEQGLCQMAMEAVQDILDDIDKNDSESMYIISKFTLKLKLNNSIVAVVVVEDGDTSDDDSGEEDSTEEDTSEEEEESNQCINTIVKVIDRIFGNSVIVEESKSLERLNDKDNQRYENSRSKDLQEEVSWSVSFHPINISSMITKVSNTHSRCVEPIVKVIGKLLGNRVVVEGESDSTENRRRTDLVKTEDGGSSFGFSVSFDTIDISDLVERVRNAVEAIDGCACGHLTEDKVSTNSAIRLVLSKVIEQNRKTKFDKIKKNSRVVEKKKRKHKIRNKKQRVQKKTRTVVI